jgi:hypothetical protein
MSKRVDSITVSSPAGSSNAPAVREVVRIVTSQMPDATAFTRGDEWILSDAGDPVDWHLYIHNGTTWVEKYQDPGGRVSPAGIANQTKAVNSLTDPIPDYIGQPGVDASGNDYVSIALSGTMWRKKPRVVAIKDQSNNDPINTTELEHDITQYNFNSVFAIPIIKSAWGVYVKSVTNTKVILGINPAGSGNVLYDLILIDL